LKNLRNLFFLLSGGRERKEITMALGHGKEQSSSAPILAPYLENVPLFTKVPFFTVTLCVAEEMGKNAVVIL